MKEISLTQGKFALVDDEDFLPLNRFKWRAQKTRGKFYAVRDWKKSGKRGTILMHRVIMSAPKTLQVDHRFGDTLDNRKYNLRLATNQQNNRALKRKAAGKTSRYRGVSFKKDKNRWQANIFDGRHHFLGYFQCERDAAVAYDAAAKKRFGGFIGLNFPTG